MVIVGLDPGYTASAAVAYAGGRVVAAWQADNHAVLMRLANWGVEPREFEGDQVLVIEQIQSFGMPVGAEVFETCVWTGRFLQAWSAGPAARLPRIKVKVHLCGQARATDANVRQALLDRFGGKTAAIGRKAAPGPLYHVHGDMWSALALAVTWAESR